MKSLTAAPQPTLISFVWPQFSDSQSSSILRVFMIAVAGSLLLALSSKIQVPFYPVPMTMQTFMVLTLAMVLGPRLGLASIALWFAEGAAGLPVFAGTPEKGMGLAYMFGPTGGYILGFALATAVVGWLAEKGWDRHFTLTAMAMLIGNIAIYVPGLFVLGSIAGWDKPILEWGMYPFLLGDLAKLALATSLLPMIWKILPRKKV